MNDHPVKSQVVGRQVFRTSRALEFFSLRELTLQTGHSPERWPEVVEKELTDNGLDECENSGIAPVITIELEPSAITVSDNGKGMSPDVVDAVLDFSSRVSSKDVYVSPTRGAQGNALMSVMAIPYVVSDCTMGEIEITSQGSCHRIKIEVDRIDQKPKITHEVSPDSFVKTGTRVQVHWPDLARLNIQQVAPRFLQLVEAYSLFNAHASFMLHIGGKLTRFERTTFECRKWQTKEPTSPYWYTPEQLRSLMAAYVADERTGARALTVREFVSKFRGLTGTAKQKAILSKLKLASVSLHDLVKDGDLDASIVLELLNAMREETKPVKALALGAIGEEHITSWLKSHGGAVRLFPYKRVAGIDDRSGLPFVVEVAGGMRNDQNGLRLVTGINWSPTLVNPIRSLAGHGIGLDGLLNSLHIYATDPITLVLHLACPHLRYTDRGKSTLENL